jgi:hypothetical protein
MRRLETITHFVAGIAITGVLVAAGVGWSAPKSPDTTHIHRYSVRGGAVFLSDQEDHAFWIAAITFGTGWMASLVLSLFHYRLKRIDDQESNRELATEVWRDQRPRG